MDLAQWYAQGRWVALLELIDQRPRASRLNEALVNDPESAEHLAELALAARDADGAQSSRWTPPVREFDTHAHLLSQMGDVLKQINQGITQLSGGKAKPEKPFPLPETAIDRAVERLELQGAVELAGLFGFAPEDIA